MRDSRLINVSLLGKLIWHLALGFGYLRFFLSKKYVVIAFKNIIKYNLYLKYIIF